MSNIENNCRKEETNVSGSVVDDPDEIDGPKCWDDDDGGGGGGGGGAARHFDEWDRWIDDWETLFIVWLNIDETHLNELKFEKRKKKDTKIKRSIDRWFWFSSSLSNEMFDVNRMSYVVLVHFCNLPIIWSSRSRSGRTIFDNDDEFNRFDVWRRRKSSE